MTGVDLDAREVTSTSSRRSPTTTSCSALGAEVNFFGTEGAAEHAFPMYTLPDAVGSRITSSSGGRPPTGTRA